MEAVQDSLQAALDWLATTGARWTIVILGGSLAAYVVARLVRAVVGRALHRGITSLEGSEWQEARRLLPRLRTLEAVVNRTITSVVAAIVLFIVAADLGVRLEPLLASAGLVGIAIAFGAQTLIRDTLSGIFLLTDGTYNVGDYVRINAVEGIVSDISLRRTLLLGDDGTVHTVPNGAITVISNFTRDLVHHTLVLRVDRSTSLEDIDAVLADVSSELTTAPEVGDALVRGPEVSGITAFRGTQYELEISSTIRPALRRRWPQLLNARLMRGFERRDIRLPD